MTIAEGDQRLQPHVKGFQKALQNLGWTQARNLWIDYRLASADPGRIRAAAVESVCLKPDVLLAHLHPGSQGSVGADPNHSNRLTHAK